MMGIDWNDLHAANGLEAARVAINSQLATANEQQASLPADADDDLLNPPPVLAKEGYHGILADVVKTACKSSEASPVAVAANFLATFSAMVGRVAFQHIGDGTCHARPFFLLVGRTGKARKGTAEFTVRKIFDAVELITVDAYPSMQRHEGGLSTGEGMGKAIRDKLDEDDDEGTDDKRMLIVESEFAGAMSAASRERNTLSATIRTSWDGKHISPLVSNSKWCASNPHICITGHITSQELLHRWDDVDAQSGFLNRFVILHIVRAKLVAMPKPTRQEEIERLAGLVAESVRFAIGEDYTANNSKEIRMSHDAITLWCNEYPALTAEQSGIAGALLVRVEIYCRMFAMVFALLDRSEVIEPQHIRAALAWINYWKASVSYIFQTLSAKAEAERLDATSNEVLEFIRANPRCSKTVITTMFKNRFTGPQITDALNHLLNAAPPLIIQRQLPRADGKPGKGTIVFWVDWKG
ncbi:hypothetical protein QZJ86_05725 [Methylomonas montana]|uniref:hypothetical protein n=1 Tax=Methylomonas montana TaxID=3058963 RepID=UPI0026587093|nr:hypothetical protein [Methylomonas montana]WKJ91633.1 hypothetical protein QZJ86_05725 [Methylomonas montana]